jgi:NAD(P)-dependent dehydrogenase (short-subunit alcohol dehydrogenase family)
MARLSGKRALITGAASGIGAASARLFAREGASVLLLDRDEGVHAIAAEVEAAGGRAIAVTGSVADEDVVQGAIARAVAELGGLDCLFANAGISGGIAPILQLPVAEWRAVLEVNLLGAFLGIKHGAAAMIEAGVTGSIICTASVAGLRAAAGPAHYSASKAAVINLVQNAAFQLGGTGVRVNAICPGLIETGMTRPVFEMARAAGKEAKLGQLNPSRRAGEPSEIAEVAVFLASEASSYVNGHALIADGGLSSAHPHVPGRMW